MECGEKFISYKHSFQKFASIDNYQLTSGKGLEVDKPSTSMGNWLWAYFGGFSEFHSLEDGQLRQAVPGWFQIHQAC